MSHPATPDATDLQRRGEADPLIVTLALDPSATARFEAERRAHFPPRLNRIPAHITLFHHLPGEAEGEVAGGLAAVCATAPTAIARITGLMSLGRGVAYRLDAPEVATLRGTLARMWDAWLTPQDRQPWRPHVTVQNKVDPDTARATLEALRAAFAPFDAVAEGLLLWRYLGGPWAAAGRFPFGEAP